MIYQSDTLSTHKQIINKLYLQWVRVQWTFETLSRSPKPGPHTGPSAGQPGGGKSTDWFPGRSTGDHCRNPIYYGVQHHG